MESYSWKWWCRYCSKIAHSVLFLFQNYSCWTNKAMVMLFLRWRVFISLAVTQDLQIHLERLLILKAFNVASETESDSQKSKMAWGEMTADRKEKDLWLPLSLPISWLELITSLTWEQGSTVLASPLEQFQRLQ